MSLSDDIKAKIKDAEIDKHLSTFIDEAEHVINTGVTKAGGVAHEKRGDVTDWLDKASAKVNEKTDSKYAEHVTKVRSAVLASLDKLAEKRADNTSDPAAPADPQELPPTT